MRGVWSTLALVAVAAGLGAYIYFVDADRPAGEVKEKVFTVAADDIEELRVTAKGETSVLKKADGKWMLVEPVATDADQNEVTALIGGLTSLDITREVDANASSLAEYGLTAPKSDITFTAKGGVTGRVRLGDQTPTGSDLYAVKGDEARVVLVATFVETSLARSPFDLRDKRVLRFERDQADGLEITAAGRVPVTFTRANSDWRVTAPVNARGDYGAIEGLLTRLSTTMMSGIETTDLADLKKYGLDNPASSIVVKAGSSTATLVVGTSVEGKAYARDLARPMVFTVDPAFATELLKEAGEYRKKELFEFRAFSAKKLIVTRGADTITLTKVAGTGDNPVDKWTITAGGTTRDADAAKMDDLLAKVANLRADVFVAAAPAAASTPALDVHVEFDDDKQEDASIGRDGADAYGTRPDEAGAMKLTASAVDEALTALDAVLAPPPPAAAAPPENKK
ncbi:MAG: DUF4340 domain-containing protein [Acidobacteria bacterium]|nr:DUF4340 domain-containing protein [Acidobacteriota bacterium]